MQCINYPQQTQYICFLLDILHNFFSIIYTHLFVNRNNIKPYTEVTTTFSSIYC